MTLGESVWKHENPLKHADPFTLLRAEYQFGKVSSRDLVKKSKALGVSKSEFKKYYSGYTGRY